MTDGTRPASVVVVGAGQGGYQTAASLREHGYPGRITLIGAEDALPYERPPLSKAYLKGEADEAALRTGRAVHPHTQDLIRLSHELEGG